MLTEAPRIRIPLANTTLIKREMREKGNINDVKMMIQRLFSRLVGFPFGGTFANINVAV